MQNKNCIFEITKQISVPVPIFSFNKNMHLHKYPQSSYNLVQMIFEINIISIWSVLRYFGFVMIYCLSKFADRICEYNVKEFVCY